jgi:ribonuclease P protein component
MTRGAQRMSRFSPREVRTVFAQGKRYTFDPGLTFIIAPRLGNKGRLLVITPRKLGNAIERNTLRRRLKAAFFELGLYTSSFDCLVLARRKAVALPYQLLKNLLFQAFTRHQQPPT